MDNFNNRGTSSEISGDVFSCEHRNNSIQSDIVREL